MKHVFVHNKGVFTVTRHITVHVRTPKLITLLKVVNDSKMALVVQQIRQTSSY